MTQLQFQDQSGIVHVLSEILAFYLAANCAGRSDGVVVITSALHAEGREFDPRSDLHFVLGLCHENALNVHDTAPGLVTVLPFH